MATPLPVAMVCHIFLSLFFLFLTPHTLSAGLTSQPLLWHGDVPAPAMTVWHNCFSFFYASGSVSRQYQPLNPCYSNASSSGGNAMVTTTVALPPAAQQPYNRQQQLGCGMTRCNAATVHRQHDHDMAGS